MQLVDGIDATGRQVGLMAEPLCCAVPKMTVSRERGQKGDLTLSPCRDQSLFYFNKGCLDLTSSLESSVRLQKRDSFCQDSSRGLYKEDI